MRAVRIRIPGRPVPKERPRRGKGGRWYTPRRTAQYEQLIGHMARALTAGRDWPTDGSYQVDVTVRHSSKRPPDLDNILKTVLDGLQGVLYEDDRQVARVTCARKPGSSDLVSITVRVLDAVSPR